MQGVARNQVRLLPHDPAWETEFLQVKEVLLALHGANAAQVEHIGSTAIRSICAKPILDVLLVVHSLADLDCAAMIAAGYDDRGLQQPDLNRRLFVLRSAEGLSLRHIHCCGVGDPEIARLLAFRDYLNAHPRDAKAYESLKLALAVQYADDRPSYTAAKREFIEAVCQKAVQS